MRRTARTASTHVALTPLTGGINTATPPHRLSDGEMVDCVNFLYPSGTSQLAPRGGLTKLAELPAAIRALYADADTNTLFVFLVDRSVYLICGTDTPTLIGTLTGSRLPACAKFQNKLYLASGDRLQVYDYTEPIATVEDGPLCDLVFVRSSRLCTALTGSDRIRYSAIGDGASWQTDTNDASSAGWIDIGYGDSGDISAIVPLASDLIVFKTNGRIYQFCADGTPDAWRITELASDAFLRGSRCATHLRGSVVYLTDRGLVSLTATADYGNLSTQDIGDRFASLADSPAENARFFPLKRQGILLIRPHEDKRTLIAYHSALGIATRLTFALPIEDVIETADRTIFASDRTLYRQDTTSATDDGNAIDYRIALRHLQSTFPLHLTAVYADLASAFADTVTLTANGAHPLTIKLTAGKRTRRYTNHTADCLALTLTSVVPFTPHDVILSLAEL